MAFAHPYPDSFFFKLGDPSKDAAGAQIFDRILSVYAPLEHANEVVSGWKYEIQVMCDKNLNEITFLSTMPVVNKL